ncbi:MAG TPA: UDP-glucose/GDP-mannose dehydrogenase family protein [Vicinamibacterales bacterium]|nr:UDP-glucose/GDP-mannose dehydrogenase family protein [Vicinamibacterales bacterium]
MKIAVVGTGYVGLVLGACLAENGNTVACVDKDASKVKTLTAGKMTIYEPGLEEIVRRNVAEERLSFTTELPASVRASEIVFIAVGTPQGEDGSADLRHVLDVARAIGQAINKYTVVVDKSTVPVGTAKKVKATVAKETSHPFSVVSNPEFLKQGAAVEDFMKPDRVVIGVEPGDDRAAAVMRELYAPFTRTGAPIMMTDTASAELCKYAANSILATRISFMNEIANVCELVGANVDHVRRAIGADRRIGMPFLFPGIGYGGSCFPKDVKAMVKSADDHGYDFKILRAVESVNTGQKQRLVDKIVTHFGGEKNVAGKTIAVWGLAFKPRTDDMREAPAITIIDRLLSLEAKVRAYDPEANETARGLFGDRITLCEKSYDALSGADALAVLTEWNNFREPDFEKIRKLLKTPVVFDGRNVYSPEQMRALGFTYVSIGR